MEALEQLREALIELEEDSALAAAQAALADGVRALLLLETCQTAMRVIGERYERQEYYLSGLILAGEIFREVIEMAGPRLERELTRGRGSGTVLLGTAQGDIHDIGKNIFATAAKGFGLTVIDLGVDVSPARFLAAAAEHHPDVIGISGLITGSYAGMKAIVGLLRASAAALGGVPPILLGGGVDREVMLYVGADSWTNDAVEGVHICQRLIHKGSSQG